MVMFDVNRPIKSQLKRLKNKPIKMIQPEKTPDGKQLNKSSFAFHCLVAARVSTKPSDSESRREGSRRLISCCNPGGEISERRGGGGDAARRRSLLLFIQTQIGERDKTQKVWRKKKRTFH